MFERDDCLNALKYLSPESVDLVYLDPPFFTQKQHKQINRDNSKEYTFNDYWRSIKEYKQYIKKRLEVCHKLLKDSGSVFLHCDKSASHHLRIVLDEVFGEKNFQSEIIWVFRRWSNAKKGLLNSHQVIFFYSKSANFNFNQIYQAYSPATNIDQIFQQRARNEMGKTTYKKNGSKSVLLENKKGVPLSDVWEIPYLNPKAKERVGYPTQKPIELLEKIVALVTKEGDLVFDPFCGSGTTLVAAALMRRKFFGMDIAKEAIILAQSRIARPIKTESELHKYGRESYRNLNPKISALIEKINGYPVQRNCGIDGFLKDRDIIKPIPIKIQRENESFVVAKNKLLKACKRHDFEYKILISRSLNSNEYCPELKLHIIPKALASSKYIRSAVLE